MTRKIGLIPGTGKQSKGIALRLGKAGYTVMLGSRTKEKAIASAVELNEKLGIKAFLASDNKEVAKECNVIFMVIPFEFMNETINELKQYFHPETIIVDVMVPLVYKDGYMQCVHDALKSSVSEMLQSLLPENITVVGAFKTVSASILWNIAKHSNLDVFITGDNKNAKDEIMNIISKIDGIRPLDAGPLMFSRTTEQMTALVININKLNKLKHASYKLVTSEH